MIITKEGLNKRKNTIARTNVLYDEVNPNLQEALPYALYVSAVKLLKYSIFIFKSSLYLILT